MAACKQAVAYAQDTQMRERVLTNAHRRDSDAADVATVRERVPAGSPNACS